MFLFRVWYICVMVFALLGIPTSAWDYCQENSCPFPRAHVACNNNGTLGSKCLKAAHLIPLKKKFRQFILFKINFVRNKVAAGKFFGFRPAIRMATVRWDPELATLAEMTVKQCSLSKDSCRNTKIFKHVGQLTGRMDTGADQYSSFELLTFQIDKWVKAYEKSDDKKPNSFRQLVKDRSTHVGCGVLRQSRNNWSHQQFIVCNFAREDMTDEPAYEEGPKPAAGCQTGVHPRHPNLCSFKEQYDVNSPVENEMVSVMDNTSN